MGSMAPAASSVAAAAPSGAASGRSASGAHNDADVAFATGMIPHHAQAVQMAELALQRSASPEVKDLATKVKAAQEPEITQLAGWLTGWGKPVPATDGTMAMDHGSGGHGDMKGMMTEEQMAELAAAQGRDFDTRWLQMMIEHHEGAVSMAQEVQAGGSNPDARKLAQTIATTQAAEIATMKGLQASLS
jgi:uncharacterized protein (DUF305 family)